MARPSRSFNLELLEDRCVPATWGNPWPDAPHLTLSFAPDGTALGGQASGLFATFASTPGWRRELLRAFQTWVVEGGLNIGLVADGGQALGSAGRPQGDARFGDIRIAAGEFADTELIFSSPFDLAAGTSSGDVRVNSRLLPSSAYDLYTAMLQEVGHVLGVGNSTDPGSVMYEEDLGRRSGLSAGDVASLRALYGARQADIYEGPSGNGTLGTAARLSLLSEGEALSVSAEGDLTTRGDVDVYRFQAPSLTGGMVVTLHRAGYSLLTPRVTVYDGAGRVVGSSVSTDPTGGDLTVRLDRVSPLGTYYVKVEGASGDVFDVGGYRLTVRSLPVVNSLLGSLTGTVQEAGEALTRNDLHTNDSFTTAQNLLAGLFAPDSKFDVAYQASISDSWDVDYYKIQAPATLAGDSALQVMAWGVGKSQLLPRVTVFDAGRNEVAMQTLVREGGAVVLQLVGYRPGQTYYVRVEASPEAATGNYFLGVDFRAKATELKKFVESRLDAATPSQTGRLSVTRTSLFHFVLSADANDGTGVEMTITDRQGNVVGRLAVSAGESASLTLTLATGDYAVCFRAFRKDGKAVTAVRYLLEGILLTDPIGPQPEDTTNSPSSPPPSSTSSSSYQSSYSSSQSYSSTEQSGSYDPSWYSWYWSGSTSSGGPQPEDPYGQGYTA